MKSKCAVTVPHCLWNSVQRKGALKDTMQNSLELHVEILLLSFQSVI